LTSSSTIVIVSWRSTGLTSPTHSASHVTSVDACAHHSVVTSIRSIHRT